MDILLFEYFLVLAETLNYTKAADQLFKSESVLSRQISKLESNLGIKLFDRNKRTVSITPAGKALAAGLKTLAQDYASLLEECEAIQEGYSGTIRIAALSGVVLQRRVVEILMGFEQKYPNIRIDLRTFGLGELRNLILEHRIDFIYGSTDDFYDNPVFSCDVVCHAKKYLVVSKKHPLAGRNIEELSFADFKNDTFLFTTYQTLYIKAVSSICQKCGFLPKYETLADEGMLILWVEMQRGITLLDETHMFRGNEELEILPLPELGCTELGIISDTTNRKPCNLLFLDYVREVGEGAITPHAN